MQVVTLLTVARGTESFLQEAEREYLSRLKHYCKLEVRLLVPEDEERLGAEKANRKENEKLRAAIPKGAGVVACALQGKAVTSEDMGQLLAPREDVCFLIGGSRGLDGETLALAERSISFGRMTLPHQLFRVVLLEQLYRGYAILAGSPYHK